MLVLGIDPGTAKTGYAVVEDKLINYKKPSKREMEFDINLIEYGVIITKKQVSMPYRLKTIALKLEDIILKYSPQVIAIEQIFFNANTKTAISVGQARGVLLLLSAQFNIEVAEYTPLQIKQVLTGYGRAEKIQIQSMIKNILNLKEIPKPNDAADAIAVSICHILSAPFQAKIKERDVLLYQGKTWGDKIRLNNFR